MRVKNRFTNTETWLQQCIFMYVT